MMLQSNKNAERRTDRLSRIFSRQFRRELLISFACLVLLAGCATSNLDQFQKFVDASNAYATAVEKVTQEAGETAIDFDSQSLVRQRKNLSSESLRKKTLLNQNEKMKEYLGLLRKLRAQTQILKDYFNALNALATTKSTGVSQAAENLVVRLGELDKGIKDAKVGNLEVSKFVGEVTNIVVAQMRNAALQKELRARSPFIERQLDLQRAAFKAIGESMKTDLQGLMNYRMTDEVIKPYLATNPELPNNWAERRKKVLMEGPVITVIEDASRLAGELKQSFVSLAEGRLNWASVQEIIRNAQDIITIIEHISPPKTKQ